MRGWGPLHERTQIRGAALDGSLDGSLVGGNERVLKLAMCLPQKPPRARFREYPRQGSNL